MAKSTGSEGQLLTTKGLLSVLSNYYSHTAEPSYEVGAILVYVLHTETASLKGYFFFLPQITHLRGRVGA